MSRASMSSSSARRRRWTVLITSEVAGTVVKSAAYTE